MTAEPTNKVVLVRPSVHVVITHDGAKLAAFVYQGPDASSELTPILMLHGNGGSHGSFAQVAAQFYNKRTVVIPDMRAQGISERGTKHLNYELLAQDALCILDALDIEQAVVHGYSDGGIEALLLARDHPERVSGILTMGANLTPEGVVSTPDYDMGQEETLYRSVAAELPKAAEQADLFRLMIEEPSIQADSLNSISCPATIMAGEFDIIRPEETTLIARSIPEAHLVIVPEASHSLMRDAPTIVEAELRQLLALVDAR